jgi:hypothetical protein
VVLEQAQALAGAVGVGVDDAEVVGEHAIKIGPTGSSGEEKGIDILSILNLTRQRTNRILRMCE